MRPPSRPVPGPVGRDLTLGAASLAGGLALFAVGTQPQLPWRPEVPAAWFLGPLAAVCVAVGLRRAATRSSLALGTGAVVVDLLLGGSLGTVLIYTQVLYDACVYGSARTWRWLLRITVGLSVLAAVAGVLALAHWRGVAVAVPVVLVGVLPVLTGISVRQYRDQAATERVRAEQTARLAELDRRQAVTAERTRMARELHDVVANHLSAVAIHATAALSVPGLDRSRVDEALRVIRESSVQGMAEMRQLIGVLREPAGPDDPVGPTRVRLDELDRLVERVRGAGLAVRATVTGPARPLPVGVDLAGYRIVQESLTNALRHGTGTAELSVAYRPDRLVITVTNPVRDGAPDAGTGHGLIGMRERAALLDGRFDADVRDGRWRVHVELPTGETP